jgi:hypothetical protein
LAEKRGSLEGVRERGFEVKLTSFRFEDHGPEIYHVNSRIFVGTQYLKVKASVVVLFVAKRTMCPRSPMVGTFLGTSFGSSGCHSQQKV